MGQGCTYWSRGTIWQVGVSGALTPANYGENREISNTIDAQTCCRRLVAYVSEFPDAAGPADNRAPVGLDPTTPDTVVTSILNQQHAEPAYAGSFGGYGHAGSQAPTLGVPGGPQFQVGKLLASLVFAYEAGGLTAATKARIPGAVTAALAYHLAQSIPMVGDPTRVWLQYSYPCPTVYVDPNLADFVGGPDYANLNPFWQLAAAWASRVTGDAAWRAWSDKLAKGADAERYDDALSIAHPAWYQSDNPVARKQLDEYNYKRAYALAYLAA